MVRRTKEVSRSRTIAIDICGRVCFPPGNNVVAMKIQVSFYSYFKDLTGKAQIMISLPDASTIAQLYDRLTDQFPKLAAMRKSTLIAVGVEYQDSTHVLKDGDEVSLFPPVQGG